MSKVQVVWFRDLKLWSVALQNQTTLKSHFPLIELKEILVDLTEHRKITILDNEFYKEPTISSKTNEISIRKSGLGSEFKVKKRVKILKGDLVIAKMHTQNGLYAFANDEFASTTTFIPFKILENKINKNYLFILLKQTLARLQKFDSVNRETYKTDEILSLQIPLPPLKIQKQIVAKIESIKAQIKALQEEEKRLKDEIEAYIYIALGLKKKQEAKRQKVFIVRFKDLDRWDTRHNQSIAINLCHTDSIPCHTKQPNCHTDSTPCHTEPLGEVSQNADYITCHTEAIAEVSTNIESKPVIMSEANNLKKYNRDISPTAQSEASLEYDNEMSRDISLPLNMTNLKTLVDSIPTPPPHGWEVKTLGEICEINPKIDFKELTKLEKEVSFLPMEAVKTDGETFEKLQRKAREAQGFTKFANNDLLWAKITPCMQNKKSLVVSGLKNGFGFGSTEFFVLRSKDSKQINSHFILQFLRLDLILQSASETFKGSAGQQRVPKEFLQNLKIPLPPLKVQEQIVNAIEMIKAQIAIIDSKLESLETRKAQILESALSEGNERERTGRA